MSAVETVEFNLDLAARYRPLVESVGLGDREITAEDCYYAYRRIADDPAVSRLRMLPEFHIKTEETCAFETDWPKLFERLGPAECAAIGRRIGPLPRNPYIGTHKGAVKQ